MPPRKNANARETAVEGIFQPLAKFFREMACLAHAPAERNGWTRMDTLAGPRKGLFFRLLKKIVVSEVFLNR